MHFWTFILVYNPELFKLNWDAYHKKQYKLIVRIPLNSEKSIHQFGTNDVEVRNKASSKFTCTTRQMPIYLFPAHI